MWKFKPLKYVLMLSIVQWDGSSVWIGFEYRSPLNGGLHIKQESMMLSDHHHQGRESEQLHQVIKHEIHSEYDEVEQEPPGESMAEDLTVGSDHTEPGGVLDA